MRVPLVDFDALAERVGALTHPARPPLVGVSGFGGSGKSTLATRLAAAVGAPTIVSIDSFFVHERDVRGDDWPCFDRARLLREVLEPAAAGLPVRYRNGDDRDADFDAWRIVPPQPLLVVEGCGLFHPELRGLFDLTVWVECPLETATSRGIARDSAQFGVDMTRPWRERWEPNERDFLAAFHPDRSADLRISTG